MAVQDATQQLTLTPSQIEGPYFRLAAPHTNDVRVPGRKGDRLRLHGKVVNVEGTPIPNTIINFWQSDEVGNYDMLGHYLHGYVITDAKGEYEFTTIVPACYEPRDAQHIHVKVQGVSQPLTTQLYFSNDEPRVKDRYYMRELEVQMTPSPEGGFDGEFDFVIKQVTQSENVTPESLAATLSDTLRAIPRQVRPAQATS